MTENRPNLVEDYNLRLALEGLFKKIFDKQLEGKGDIDDYISNDAGFAALDFVVNFTPGLPEQMKTICGFSIESLLEHYFISADGDGGMQIEFRPTIVPEQHRERELSPNTILVKFNSHIYWESCTRPFTGSEDES